MKNTNREVIFLRAFAFCSVAILTMIPTMAFKSSNSNTFKTIDVERINVVEADGTVKLIITNTQNFPSGEDKVNGKMTNKTRKKRSGMLFYTEDGIESGGLIYDGNKTENGHSSGLSLTFDQYDGDQVMQMLTTDEKRGDRRLVSSALVFNDRPLNETQEMTSKLMEELDAIKDRAEKNKKYNEYVKKGLLGGAPRVMLGKTASENNGLFLFGKNGNIKAMFYVDKEDKVKFEVFDDKGQIKSSWPE